MTTRRLSPQRHCLRGTDPAIGPGVRDPTRPLLATVTVLLLVLPAVTWGTSRQECLDACVQAIADCPYTCGVCGIHFRRCRVALLRQCKRHGIQACRPTAPPFPCGDRLPTGSPLQCEGTCPDGYVCQTVPGLPSHCQCYVAPSWRILCGTSGRFPVCDGSCPPTFECRPHLRGLTLESDCLCQPIVSASDHLGAD